MVPTQQKPAFNPNPRREDGTYFKFTDPEFVGQSWRHFGRDNGFDVVEFANGPKLYLTEREFAQLKDSGNGMGIAEFKAMQAGEDKAMKSDGAEKKQYSKEEKEALKTRAEELGLNTTAKSYADIEKMIAEKEAELAGGGN